MSADLNFSSIARELLLRKPREDAQKRLEVVLIEGGNGSVRIADHVNSRCRFASAVRLPRERSTQSRPTPLRVVLARALPPEERKPDVKCICNGSCRLSRNSAPLPQNFSVRDGMLIYSRVRDLNVEMLSQRVGKNVWKKYGPNEEALMFRVWIFFDVFKTLLGPTCKGTLFDSPAALTAAACGVSFSTIVRMGNRLREVGSIPWKCKAKVRDRRQQSLAVLKRYGSRWGETVRQHIRCKLKQRADVRVATLHRDLKYSQPEFNLSTSTLYRLVRALGFSYKFVSGRWCIFESPSDNRVLEGNSDTESEDDSEGVECDYHELMEEDFVDEPWMLESVDKKKEDETAPCYVFRPANSITSNTGEKEVTSD